MNRLAAALVALIALAALPLRAEPVTGYTLDNGLEIVVIEDHRAPIAVHMVWYRAGAADAAPGRSGIAHLLEHLMFKGTETRAAGEFSDIVEANGGNDNAFTSQDFTGYFQRVAADRLELMMELEADRMANLDFSEQDWRTERDVILEERAQRVDSRAGAIMGERMRAALYLNHPYGTPIIGWRHEIEALSGDDATEFYSRHYAPNNAVLVVAGDVDPDEVRAMAERHYGPIRAGADIAPRTRPQEPPHLSERRVSYTDPRVGQPYVMRLQLAPARRPGDQAEAAALTVLADLLGGSPFTSVLAEALQFDREIALQVAAGYDGMRVDDATFTLGVVPVPGVSLDEAEAALDAALADFLETGIDPERFERIKTDIRASQIYARDDMRERARRYGTALTSGLTVADVRAWPEALDAVTREDVMTAARALLENGRGVTGRLVAPAEEPNGDGENS